MQIAILIVLVVIAVILAPWLFGVLFLGVAAYGIWLMTVVIGAFVIAIGIGVWLFISSVATRDKSVKLTGPRRSCPNCQVEMPANAVSCRSCGKKS